MKCDCCLPDEFGQQTKSLNRQEMFSLSHLNIRSISNKFDSFKRLINTLNLPFQVIGPSETWLNENNMDSFSLDNFQFLGTNRPKKEDVLVFMF